MKLRAATLILLLALGLLAVPLPVEAQRPAKIPRIGFLVNAGPVPRPVVEPFRQGLRDLGYVEGQNIVIEWRSAMGKYDRLRALAAELVDLKVDLLVATAPQASRAVKEATTTIPIVFIAVADPVRVGLVASFARPGGNITGLSTLVPGGFAGKRLELLKETVPGLSRLAVLANPTNR
ncbi:MAG: ABC transporter substrate-binding protein, partial [Anaerolineae bacterium]